MQNITEFHLLTKMKTQLQHKQAAVLQSEDATTVAQAIAV